MISWFTNDVGQLSIIHQPLWGDSVIDNLTESFGRDMRGVTDRPHRGSEAGGLTMVQW